MKRNEGRFFCLRGAASVRRMNTKIKTSTSADGVVTNYVEGIETMKYWRAYHAEWIDRAQRYEPANLP